MIKVIIVEDEDNIRNGINYMVNWESCGCTVVGTAWNGKEGLGLIQRLNPDIVITDVSMPYLDGLEMIQKAKETHDFETIIISGYSEFEYARKAIELNVSQYILKPIDYSEVECALKEINKSIEEHRDQDTDLIIHYSKKMRSIIDYIDLNIEEKITLDNLCDHFKMSSTSLNKLFKNEVNTTANDYINSTKIKKSIEMIKSEKYLIYEIAEMLGFNNYKYFSQVFKKYTHYSPTEFMKQHQH